MPVTGTGGPTSITPAFSIPSLTLDVINASRYYGAVIVSFKDVDAQRLAQGNRVGRFVSIEALKGDRAGQHSIRVNDQFRICFRWTVAGPEDVEIVDYH